MRLFFALWPDDAVRARMAAVADSIAERAGGRIVPAAKLHLTLAFLGEVAEGRVPDVLEAGNSVRGTPFEMVLDTIGSFRAAQVAWAAPSGPPRALLVIQALLDQELRSNGFVLDGRPFTPHATLARKIVTVLPAGSMTPIGWTVGEFVLVRSEPGRGNYSVMQRWTLGK